MIPPRHSFKRPTKARALTYVYHDHNFSTTTLPRASLLSDELRHPRFSQVTTPFACLRMECANETDRALWVDSISTVGLNNDSVVLPRISMLAGTHTRLVLYVFFFGHHHMFFFCHHLRLSPTFGTSKLRPVLPWSTVSSFS